MQPEVSQIVPPDIRIAMCETVAACHACEDLQLAVWGGSERELVPYDILRAIVHAGGTVLGAWDGERMVGIALSFVAWGASGAYHHSHLLGVLPDYRRWGIGWRLKMAQRAFILAQGLDLLTWTFDPLESANAHLNFAKLGVISQTYLPDFYGAMPEALNAGLPSDRLLVEWHLRSPHALARLAAAEMDASAIPLVSADAQDAPFLLRMSADRAPESTPHSLMTPGDRHRAIPHRDSRRYSGDQVGNAHPRPSLAEGDPRRVYRRIRPRLLRRRLPLPPLPPPGMRLLSPAEGVDSRQ